jgi:putative oxidoreductase
MSCVRIFVSEPHSLEWIGILMARIAVGSLFFLSGRAKLFVRERREQMEQILIEAHIPFPKFNAVFVSRWSLFAGYCSPLGQ